ncbi:MAG: VOC family protein [Asticcacaulis sp.]
MAINVYLSFNGQAAEAFAFYQSVLGGQLETFPFSAAPDMPVDPATKDWLMHASLHSGDRVLLGADCPPQYGPANPTGFCISLQAEDVAEAERLWAGLTVGAKSINMPLAPTFWSPMFGMFIDKFGQPWMINTVGDPSAA